MQLHADNFLLHNFQQLYAETINIEITNIWQTHLKLLKLTMFVDRVCAILATGIAESCSHLDIFIGEAIFNQVLFVINHKIKIKKRLAY